MQPPFGEFGVVTLFYQMAATGVLFYLRILLYIIPAYSPDFNPIEKMWSKIKQTLRSLKARTKEELFDALAKAMGMVTADDAHGWF